MVGMTRDDSGAGVSGCYEFRYSSFEIKVLPPLTCEIDPASFDLTAGESQALTANLTSDNDGETVNYFWGASGYDDVGVFTRLLDQGDNQITWTATNFFGELLPESLYQLAVKLVDSLNPHRQGICTTTGNVSPPTRQ